MRSDEILSHVVGPRVLDVGCAGHRVEPENPDWLHRRLSERFEVTGIDISEPNLAKMRALGYTDIHLQSAESIDLRGTFDTVVAGEIIEHVSNPGLFFSSVKRHLSPQGRLVLTTPYVFSLMYALYALHRFPKTCENSEHAFWLCPATITELARREGLQVESWKLIDDYAPSVTSFKYRVYWSLMRTIGRALPQRIKRTTMLLVLRHSA